MSKMLLVDVAKACNNISAKKFAYFYKSSVFSIISWTHADVDSAMKPLKCAMSVRFRWV